MQLWGISLHLFQLRKRKVPAFRLLNAHLTKEGIWFIMTGYEKRKNNHFVYRFS